MKREHFLHPVWAPFQNERTSEAGGEMDAGSGRLSRKRVVASLTAGFMMMGFATQVAHATSNELRAPLPSVPALADLIAVDGANVLARFGGSFQWSGDSGVHWQPVTLPLAGCADLSCSGFGDAETEGVAGGILGILKEDGNQYQYARWSLSTHTAVGTIAGGAVDQLGDDIVSAQGSYMLIEKDGDESNTYEVLDFSHTPMTSWTVNLSGDQDVVGITGSGQVVESSATGFTIVDQNLPIASLEIGTQRAYGAKVNGSRLAFEDDSGRLCMYALDRNPITGGCQATVVSFGRIYELTDAGALVGDDHLPDEGAPDSYYWFAQDASASAPAAPQRINLRDDEDWQQYSLPIDQATGNVLVARLRWNAESSSIARIGSSGVTDLVTLSITSPVQPMSLDLTPTTLLDEFSVDNYNADRVEARSVGVAEIGSGSALDASADLIGGSAGRWALATDDGIQLYDRGVRGRLLSGLACDGDYGCGLSGPYLAAGRDDPATGMTSYGLVMATGEWQQAPNVVAMFGSLVLETTGTDGTYQVRDVAGTLPTVPVTVAGDDVGHAAIWGDWVGFSRTNSDDDDADEVVLMNYRTGESTIHIGDLKALGDGVALLREQDDTLVAWNFRTGEVTPIPMYWGDNYYGPTPGFAMDGNRVVTSTDNEFVITTVPGTATSAPRSLGVIAPPTLDLAKGASWSADIDLTKPVQAGQLQLKDSTGKVVRSIPVPASADGSLRAVTWDGRNDAGICVPSGVYSYVLTNQATDGSGAVRAIDGTGRALGQIAVTGGLAYVVPTISGNASVGQTLTVVPGTWGPSGVQLTYQWRRSGAAITGATGTSYVVQPDDAGTTLSVAVTGTLAGYASSVVVSAETAKVPGAGQLELTATPAPTISGTARVGSALTAIAGTWTPAPVTLTYQWLRSGANIPGATASTYTLTGDDAGTTVQIAVTGSKDGYQSVTQTSKPTGKVANGSLSQRPTPTVDGIVVVDQTLTAVSGTWGPGTVDLAYQWYQVSSSGKSTLLAGKTGSTYQVQAADVGSRLSVRLTGSARGYDSASVYSTPTAKVARASFTSIAAPSVAVSGTPRVGKTVTAVPGTASPAGTSWSYQWYRVSVKGKAAAIKKATKPAYVLTSADLGYQVKVKATVNRVGYNPVATESALTAKVGAGLSGVKPRLSDTTPAVGQSLTITEATGVGKWSSQPVTPGFEWLRDGKTVVGTDATYTVQSADAGHKLSVRLTGSKDDYAPLVMTSSASSKVAKASFATKGAVTIGVSGTVFTAVEGDWAPSPDSFGYQWYRNGKAIGKATNKTYDHGSSTGEYKVKVTAIKAGYNTASAYSPVLKA